VKRPAVAGVLERLGGGHRRILSCGRAASRIARRLRQFPGSRSSREPGQEVLEPTPEVAGSTMAETPPGGPPDAQRPCAAKTLC
jgi:hypothetical protein